jgi:hypothetical protein
MHLIPPATNGNNTCEMSAGEVYSRLSVQGFYCQGGGHSRLHTHCLRSMYQNYSQMVNSCPP